MAPRRYSPAPPVPGRVRIELTARCDLQCLHCAGAMHARSRGDMDYRLFVSLLGHLRALGVREVALSYLGEPFLCPWLPEAIRCAKQNVGFESVILATNGRMATPERVRECIEAGLDSLEFSANFAGPEQFHYVTGAREQDFWRLEMNLKAARLVRDEVEARTGRHCAVVATSLRFDEMQASRMRKTLARVREAVDSHSWQPLRRLKMPCPALFAEANITYDGRLSACPYDHDPRFGMGDLTCETFLEGWHDERFQRLREAHLTRDVRGTPCEGCAAYG